MTTPTASPSRTEPLTLAALRALLARTRLADRPRFERELVRMSRRHAQVKPESLARLAAAMQASEARVQRLQGLPLQLSYDPILPITAHREEIARALQSHQVVVVCGATGSGKTTQLPKICLEAGRGSFGLIGHTQPRRLAAHAIADRLAAELGTTLGEAVGYQVRFTDKTGPDSRVKVMTDGILLRELEHDRRLLRYDTLIIDEAHERSLNIDFLLGVLQRLLKQRADLKVIITSATIDPQRFARFFGDVPVIEVSGRTYPVEVRYRPLADDDEDVERSQEEGIIAALQELERHDRGDVLVFLPGEKQIRDAARAIEKAQLRSTEVLALYARLSAAEQQKIFASHSQRRVVLATNVAETSLTVPGIRHVIDTGLARISRYSVRSKVQRLPIERISQASADQRKGRAGREAPGICIRLYAEDEFALREPFTAPEILRTNLASVILQMSALDLGEPQDFPFIDPPDTRLINDGYRLLQELKAVDAERKVTTLGRKLSTLPLDPRLARMLIASVQLGCLQQMLVISSFLAMQDPRERPADAQTQADQKHAEFADPRSDFMTVLKLWETYRQQSEALSGNQLRRWCREHYLSVMRMREWHELHRQLKVLVKALSPEGSQEDTNYANLHQAILSGFLGQIGAVDERREYEGARGSRFVVAPGTPLASKPPKWLVAASLMETTRLYARMVAAVEPQWIEAAGAHLLKRSYSDPHWVADRGFVAAFETITLYGLTLAARRRVNFANIEPGQARQIFVNEALVAGSIRIKADFLEHNRQLLQEVEALEAKVRRRDIVIDDTELADFYLQRLPTDVHSTAALQKWLRNPANDKQLRLARDEVMRRETREITEQDYPDTWDVAGNDLPVSYRFEPGAGNDGLTVSLPLPVLGAAALEDFSAPIGGLRVEVITQLLRALPKQMRKQFVPVPEHAAQAAQQLSSSMEFHAALAQWIKQRSGLQISAEELAGLPLDEHLKVNLRIVDAQGKVLAQGRDLTALKRQLRQEGTQPVLRRAAAGDGKPDQAVYRDWSFGELPKERTVERRGLKFTVFPTLRVHEEGVELVEAATAADAEVSLRAAVLKLTLLALPEQFKYARQRFAKHSPLMLLAQGLGQDVPIAEGFARQGFMECFIAQEAALPRTREHFQSMLERHRGDFGAVTDRVLRQGEAALTELRQARLKLSALDRTAFQGLHQDIQRQLTSLVPADFPLGVPDLLWPHLLRYFRTLVRRVERASTNKERDAQLQAQLQPAVQAFQRLKAQKPAGLPCPQLDRLQWMIEEFRVSLFAQDLRTALPVSAKRLEEQIEKAHSEVKRAA